jgi:hypothetical protein
MKLQVLLGGDGCSKILVEKTTIAEVLYIDEKIIIW